MATPLEIMLEGPIGGAAFNNEFGRPNLCGYFRTFESRVPGLPDGEIRGYHKPIMIAGGVGNIRTRHVEKRRPGPVPDATMRLSRDEAASMVQPAIRDSVPCLTKPSCARAWQPLCW